MASPPPPPLPPPPTPPIHAPWGYIYLLSQEEAYGIWMNQVVLSVTLGGYIWDSIISFLGDCEFVFRRRFNYLTCLYMINRVSAIMYFFGMSFLSLSTTVNCSAITIFTSITQGCMQLTSAALLWIRVWILFKDQLYVPAFMFALIFPGPVMTVVIYVTLMSEKLPYNSGCTFPHSPPSWWYLPYIFQAVFDCLVFLLCTTKVAIGYGVSLRRRATHLPGGMKGITSEFLRGGFQYYIPNLLIQMITIIFIGSQPPDLQLVTSWPADAISSAQSLRITRNLWKASYRRQSDSGLELRLFDGNKRRPQEHRSGSTAQPILCLSGQSAQTGESQVETIQTPPHTRIDGIQSQKAETEG